MLVPARLASIFILAILIGTRAGAADSTPPVAPFPWAHEHSDIAPDPAITWGRLPNGMGFALRSNAEPRGRISLCLMVNTGSLLERDDQQGYAHFVEHMAFKGTRHFPAGTLVKTLQRHGMAFGAEVSAFTTQTTTYYTLNLAGNSSASLAEGLQVLRDFADGVTFVPEDIQTERGVILSERRTRDSGSERIGWDRLTALYGNTLLARRKPIGQVDCINRADRAGLVEFYETWYRPERMVLIAVGDASPQFLGDGIAHYFGDLRSRRPAVPEPVVGTAETGPGTHPALFTETEGGGGISTEISCVQPSALPPVAASLRTQMARSVACDILTMRLREEVKKDPASFGGGGASYNEFFGRFTESSAFIESRSFNWMRALVTLEHELRRALLHGFNGAEIALSAKTGLAACRYASERASTRQSEELTGGILSDLMNGRVTQAPSAFLAAVQPILNSLTPEECLEAFRALWPDERRNVLLCGALKLGDPAREIVEIYDSSRRFPLAENDEAQREQFAYTNFGPAGKIAERKFVDDLDIHMIRFGNGVCLNLKRTNYVAGTVAVRVRVGGGLSSEPPDRTGLGLLTGVCFLDSALGKHDFEAVNRLVRGSSVALNFGAEDDAFVFTGGTDNGHLRLLFQLITAYLSDPGWRSDGWTNAAGHLGSYFSTLRSDAASFAAAVGPKMVCNGDSRYGVPKFDDIKQRTLAEAKSWLGPQLRSGPVEIGVAGDMDVEAVIALAAETFGTLPSRAARALLPSKPVHPLKKPVAVETKIPSHNPKAVVWIAWITPGNADVAVSRQIDLLATILGDRIRVKIREELGATYDATAYAWESQADPQFGMLVTQMTTPPGETRRLAAIVRQISTDIARRGVTEDELERARRPVIAGLEQHLRDNGYWLYYVLDQAQERPARLDWPRTRERDFRAATSEEINALAKQYLGSDRAYTLLVAPQS